MQWVGDLSEKRMFGGRETEFLSRERSKKGYLIRAQPLNRNRSLMDRSICRALNLDMSRCYQGFFDGKNTSMDRVCRESIGQTEGSEILAQWIEEAV